MKLLPILHVHSHQMLGMAGPVFQAFGDRLRMVEMVRHPLSLVPFFHSKVDRLTVDPLELGVWLSHDGTEMPWYTRGWEKKFIAARPMDRVIFLIEFLTRSANEALDAMDEAPRARVLVIPFERFVIDPTPYLDHIGRMLDTVPTSATARILRRERVPRRHTGAGRDLPIYRRYAWAPPESGSSEASELRKRWYIAAQEASPEGLATLEAVCADYERRYLAPPV